MKRRAAILAAVSVLMLPVQTIHAGCKSDCADEYQLAKEDCMNQFDDADEADDLRLCLEDAYLAYEDCMNECDS